MQSQGQWQSAGEERYVCAIAMQSEPPAEVGGKR